MQKINRFYFLQTNSTLKVLQMLNLSLDVYLTAPLGSCLINLCPNLHLNCMHRTIHDATKTTNSCMIESRIIV